ncbi:MAG: LuxR C-terminal-related transcriptional regulator [Rikenellaceae bacterium]
MRQNRVHIVIAEPSVIIRSGLLAVLQKATGLNIDLAEISDMSLLTENLSKLLPDILIINPLHLGVFSPVQLKDYCRNLKVVALQSTLAEQAAIKNFDGAISIYDSAEAVKNTLLNVINTDTAIEEKAELSAREKEIVVCVAKGMTNKEIADVLCLSTHTVVSHRRNITNKLDIYSTSGLTIYAIVNKLIEIDSLPIK